MSASSLFTLTSPLLQMSQVVSKNKKVRADDLICVEQGSKGVISLGITPWLVMLLAHQMEKKLVAQSKVARNEQ